MRVSQSRLSHKEWRNCDTADLCDSANEAAAGLALVINMNHGAGPLCLKGHLGKKKKETIYWKKGKDQEEEGVRKFCG